MNPNIGNDNCPTCCANRREDRRIVDECDDGDTYCPDPWHATPTPPAPAPGEVVLRMNGRARSCLVANSDGKFYDSEAWDALPKGDTVYVAVPAAQRERDSAERDRRRCLDEIKRVYEAVGIDPFRDPITTCAADVKKMYDAATARADKAEAALKDALARIDALLKGKA